MCILKILGKFIYISIFFIIIVCGIVGLSNLLEKFNITGSLNSFITYLLVVYAFSAFLYDIEKNNMYKERK